MKPFIDDEDEEFEECKFYDMTTGYCFKENKGVCTRKCEFYEV